MEEIKTERDYFSGPIVRAQLNTTGVKQDTYFASIEERPVFVKGPYKNLKDATIYSMAVSLKSLLDPTIPVLYGSVQKLKVEPDFLDTKLGIRLKFEVGQVGYFLIFSDLIRESIKDELPTTTRTSKLWDDPVKVVDFSKVKTLKHFEYFSDWNKSIYCTTPAIALQIVKHLLLSWIIGTSADFASRNFLIKKGKCYQVDYEKVFCFDWKMTQTGLCSPRTKALEFIVKFVTSVWESEMELFLKNVKENSSALEDKIPKECYEKILERVNEIQTLDGLLGQLMDKVDRVAPKKRTRVD
jgi:hypothetical protein